MISFYIKTYGCMMNVYDSNKMADLLVSKGYTQVLNPYDADVLIFYTCNVREKAVHKLLSDIGRLKFVNAKVIAVGGCIAQSEGKRLFERAPSINISFGPQTYHKLPEYIDKVLKGERERIIDSTFYKMDKFLSCPKKRNVSISEHIAIQEGCDNFCTYCIVPYTRGREYSRPVKDILEEAKWLLDNGAQELVLWGQNVNSYHGEAPYITIGHHKATWRIEQLLQAVAQLPGIRRLRYSTSHPKDFNEALMHVHNEIPLLVPFTHIPVQSGSDRILKQMNRGYTSAEYLYKLNKFREICPAIQFSSDFIVGFPGETEEDFKDTLRLVEQAKYTISYSFKYSPRSGTPAAKMLDQVPEKIKEQRLKILQDTLLRDQITFNKALVDKTQEVLFYKKGKRVKQYIGKNVYMQSVVVESEKDLIGKFKDVLIKSAEENCVIGQVV